MLNQLSGLWNGAKAAYQNRKNGDFWQITGNYNIALHLHKKNSPDQSTNLQTDGNITLAVLDIAIFAGIFAVVSSVCCLCHLFHRR